MTKTTLNETALNILRGLPFSTEDEQTAADSAAHMVEHLDEVLNEWWTRHVDARDSMPPEVLRRVKGAIVAQYQ